MGDDDRTQETAPRPDGATAAAQSRIDPATLAKAEAEVAADWQVGDVLLDLYEVRGVLGEGGMGKVHRVHHRGWNVDLAVKSPKPEILARGGGAENFAREAETWVNLGLHPSTVSCYYVRTLGGIPRVFAEYVEGGSLSDWVRDRRLYAGGQREALARILDVAIQFAWGLDYAHEQALIHQDVKPANVMMTADGVAKVTDFGLARARAAAGEAGAKPAGLSVMASYGGRTPAYCSPEQAEVAAQAEAGIPPEPRPGLTRKTDIWSWGVSVLEMFFGELPCPYGGQAAREVLESFLETNAGEEQIPAMPAEVANLLKGCFEKDPARRPGTMAEVAGTLRQVYEREVGTSYPREAPRPAEAAADSLNNRAASLWDLGRQEEAFGLWEEALRLHPQHPESTYNRGLSLWRSAKVNDLGLLRVVRDAAAGSWIGHYLVALTHMERNDQEAALAALEGIQGRDAERQEVRTALAAATARLSQSSKLLRTFEGHTGPVSSVHLSADGRYALSAGEDHTLKLWELATGRCVRTFGGDTTCVSAAHLSADGRYALSGCRYDNKLKVWDVATGACVRTFELHKGAVISVHLSADGRHALSGSSFSDLKLWDVATGGCVRTFEGHTQYVSSVHLSADGRYALSGSSDRTLKLWEVATGRCLRTFEGHRDKVSSVDLSADGRYALSGGGRDRTLKLWEVATGRCLRTFEGHTEQVNSVHLSADRGYALSGSGDADSSYALPGSGDKTLKLWEMATGRCLRSLEGHTHNVNAVDLSADGRYALSGSRDKTLKLWEVELDRSGSPFVLSRVNTSESLVAGQNAHDHELEGAQAALASGDVVGCAVHLRKARSQPACSRDRDSIRAWTGLYRLLPRASFLGICETAAFGGHVHKVLSVHLSADGRYAVSGSVDRMLKLWEVATGRCLRTFEGHTALVMSVHLSADGRYALSGSTDKTLKLWEVATGRCLRTFEGHKKWVYSVRLSADGRYALSGGFEETLKLWDVATGRCVRTFEGPNPGWLGCLSVDGRYALSGGGMRLQLWDVATGRCVRTFAHEGNSVHLSADARWALSGDKTLKLSEVATGRCVRTFEGHTKGVRSVHLSADGRWALSGSGDETLKLWEVATGHCVGTFAGHKGGVNSVHLSADGRYALSGGEDKTVRLWTLDWELEDRQPADWDEGARPHLETFLACQTPYAGALPHGEPSAEEITLALTRRGAPVWTADDFQRLLYTLGCAGYGWLRPQGVRRELERMAAEWQGPPPLAEEAEGR